MIELVDREVILPVRHEVLRPTLPIESAMYPEDDTPGIFHLASRDDSGLVIGCVTFFPEALFPEALDGTVRSAPSATPRASWRFRGMATLARYQSRGIGGELLEAGVAEAQRRGAERVWCNGRATARAFYLRHGFATIGEEFSLPPAHLPHYVFVRDLRTGA